GSRMSRGCRTGRSAARGNGVRMEKVVGIGGVFFKARDPKALAAWYRERLGVPVEPGQTYGAFTSAAAGEQAVWSALPADTSTSVRARRRSWSTIASGTRRRVGP